MILCHMITAAFVKWMTLGLIWLSSIQVWQEQGWTLGTLKRHFQLSLDVIGILQSASEHQMTSAAHDSASDFLYLSWSPDVCASVYLWFVPQIDPQSADVFMNLKSVSLPFSRSMWYWEPYLLSFWCLFVLEETMLDCTHCSANRLSILYASSHQAEQPLQWRFMT